jgi:hypothetical protein
MKNIFLTLAGVANQGMGRQKNTYAGASFEHSGKYK